MVTELYHEGVIDDEEINDVLSEESGTVKICATVTKNGMAIEEEMIELEVLEGAKVTIDRVSSDNIITISR